MQFLFRIQHELLQFFRRGVQWLVGVVLPKGQRVCPTRLPKDQIEEKSKIQAGRARAQL
ncbi:hypothetical protein [Leptospira jelokensis]|uniref:hypothetical protein n=1 Tax=Leptospira jelokensis TaxID=2484931 RepID=UPI00142DCB49|nr:hypothetical protein [Leptospira jelokensis]